jgi:hypothetical protein
LLKKFAFAVEEGSSISLQKSRLGAYYQDRSFLKNPCQDILKLKGGCLIPQDQPSHLTKKNVLGKAKLSA